MAKVTQRKFFLFGKYSLALLLPKKWLSELGVGEQSQVRIEYEGSKRKITLRFDEGLLADSTKKVVKKKPTGKTSDSDETWEPIPQI